MKDAGPIRRIAIGGSGLEAWITALFLAHTLDARRVAIDVRPDPQGQNAAADAIYAVIAPAALPFLEALGLTPRLLFTQAAGGYALGVHLVGLPGIADARVPFGEAGRDWLGCAFHLHWARAALNGYPIAFADFTVAGRAMQRGVFAPPDVPGLADQGYEAGMTCDPARLRHCVRAAALAAGVNEGEEGEPPDLLIECAGIPEGRLTTVEAAEQPFVTVAAAASGWSVTSGIGPGRALRLERDATAPAAWVDPWVGTRLALGSAVIPPLAELGLAWSLLQAQLDQLIDLLPGADCAAGEVARYNRAAATLATEASSLAMLIEHARRGDLATSGDTAVALFAERGHVAAGHGLVVTAGERAKLLLALGLRPRRVDAFAQQLPPDRLAAELHALEHELAALTARFPPYGAFIAGLRRRLGAEA